MMNRYQMMSLSAIHTIHTLLPECSFTNGSRGYDAFLVVFAWYIRITNEARYREVVKRSYQQGHCRWFYRSWIGCANELIEGWLCNKRFPCYLESQMEGEDPCRVDIPEKDDRFHHHCDCCDMVSQGIMTHTDECLYVQSTRVQYSTLMEEVGILMMDRCIHYFNQRIPRMERKGNNHPMDPTNEMDLLSLPITCQEWKQESEYSECANEEEHADKEKLHLTNQMRYLITRHFTLSTLLPEKPQEYTFFLDHYHQTHDGRDPIHEYGEANNNSFSSIYSIIN